MIAQQTDETAEEPGSASACSIPRAAPDDDHGNTHWVSQAAFPLVAAGVVVFQVGVGVAVYHRLFWLAVPLMLMASHFMHGTLIGFHEASHGNLRKSRLLNDLDGLFIGTLSFMSFTLYRAAHQKHHLHLATERDEELWPFVNVDSPRWVRRLVAVIELNAGMVFTPFLFGRMFFRKNSFVRNAKVRRKIWGEFFLMAVTWTAIIFLISRFHLWIYFLWLHVLPGIIAGNLQSWRKYIEHVGLSGHTARSATRSIIADTWLGRFLSVTLLHEPYHAVHHLHAGMPHHELPDHADLLKPSIKGDIAPFPSYRSAIMHVLGNLSDPRVGSHWPDTIASHQTAPS